MADRQIKTIQWTINLPMNFPSDWDDDMIEFILMNQIGVVAILLVNLKSTMRKMAVFVAYVKQK